LVSDPAQPKSAFDRHETLAIGDLTRLVRHLGDELASYRRRALSAEARIKALDDHAAKGGGTPERSFELQQENAELQGRLEKARERTKMLLNRVRFLRQQHDGTL
jgi:hypothetical protein